MDFLTKDQILAANDLKSEEVDVPEWGGKVKVYEMTADEKDQFELSIVEVGLDDKGQTTREGKFEHYRAKMCISCMRDEAGEKLFSMKDIKLLGQKSANALQRVFNVCTRLNRVSDEDIEELVGNSDDAQPDS